MIRNDSDSILFIEPKNAPTLALVDDATRKITAAYRAGRSFDRTHGWHDCTGRGCKAMSDSESHEVYGLVTNSLCIHYVARHRDEVPSEMLTTIRGWDIEGADPTDEELGVNASGSGLR